MRKAIVVAQEQKMNYTAAWLDARCCHPPEVSTAGASASVSDQGGADLYPTFTE
jgi:hypothetical protein